MTNPRDTGRYDVFTDAYINDNVCIDFVWGNIPMQPDDDRGENTLDETLDNHIIATSGYEGFPAFLTGEPYDDTIANATVPGSLVGMTAAAATAALEAAGFVVTSTTSSVGGNAGNAGKVKSVGIPSGTVLNAGAEVAIVVYSSAGNAIAGLRWDSGSSSYFMFLVGRTVKPTNGSTVTISASGQDIDGNHLVTAVVDDDAFNTGGTKVTLAQGSSTYTGSQIVGSGLWVYAS